MPILVRRTSACLALLIAAIAATACSDEPAAPSDPPAEAQVQAQPQAEGAIPTIRFSSTPPGSGELAATKAARERYSASLKSLKAERLDLEQRYRSAVAAGDEALQAKLIEAARHTVLAALIKDIFPAWYGTAWDFNGTTQAPGEGQIACGYFVTTTLRDAGFAVPRIKMAQQASQVIITSLTGRESISIYAGKPIAEIEAKVRQSGSGLYIVGLDTHVGFVVNDGRSLAFVHAWSYNPPRAVVAEVTDSNNPLADSNYRVVGKVLDDLMVKKWLRGESFTLGVRNP